MSTTLLHKRAFGIMVGKRIAALRENITSSMTQAELAEAIGKSLRTVQKYESGDIDIPLSVLYDISIVLGVSVSYLVDCEQSQIQSVFPLTGMNTRR